MRYGLLSSEHRASSIRVPASQHQQPRSPRHTKALLRAPQDHTPVGEEQKRPLQGGGGKQRCPLIWLGVCGAELSGHHCVRHGPAFREDVLVLLLICKPWGCPHHCPKNTPGGCRSSPHLSGEQILNPGLGARREGRSQGLEICYRHPSPLKSTERERIIKDFTLNVPRGPPHSHP